MGTESDHGVPLGRLEDFQVAADNPDVRGWEVVSGDGSRLGRVEELLVDTEALRVRYLDVEVDPDLVAGERHVLVPIGYARLDEARDRVVVDALAAEELSRHPAYSTALPDVEGEVPGGFKHGLFMEPVRADLAAARRHAGGSGGAPPGEDPSAAAGERKGKVVDPLAEARWEQVRGDEAGIAGEASGRGPDETSIRPGAGRPPAGGEDDEGSGLTGGMGDPGGER